MRTAGRAAVRLALALIILAMSNSPGVYSSLDLASSPYEFGLARWELANLPGKWWHQLAGALPWASHDHGNPGEMLQAFATLSEELRRAEAELHRIAALGQANGIEQVEEQVAQLRRELDAASPLAQAALESAISQALERQGLHSLLGVVFPPVDLVFTGAPLVLVVSPRHRIERQYTALLRTRMELAEMEALEDAIFQGRDASALVVRAGGVASYPSMVDASGGLHHVATTAVHEWLHHYWFFRPLGWNYFANQTMTTLNETAANLAGVELGGIVYEAITGEEAPTAGRPQDESGDDQPPAFDFDAEMRETRLEADRLLEAGEVEKAEAYMEQRKRIFVENGYLLRKLNQAYFAFHGSYGASPASVSPIQGQVERLRASVESVGEFVRAMARFGSYADFEEYISALPPLR